MENSLPLIFGKIWPKSLYYSTGTLARFWSNGFLFVTDFVTMQELIFFVAVFKVAENLVFDQILAK